MPPRIYQSGVRAFNLPQPRWYDRAGDAWLGTTFPTFTASFNLGQSAFNIEMPMFSIDFSASEKNFYLAALMPSFEANFNVISGGSASFDITFKPFTFKAGGQAIDCDATIFNISASGTVTQVAKIDVDANTLWMESNGDISGSVTIVAPDSSSSSTGIDSVTFSGETYLVLNLKTKSHTTYRDGNNNALAETGELVFNSNKMKNVSHVHMHSRASDTVEVILTTDETKERKYKAEFAVGGHANLRNKKIPVAKGIKGTNWQIGILAEDADHLEVRSIDLIVNELKRRV